MLVAEDAKDADIMGESRDDEELDARRISFEALQVLIFDDNSRIQLLKDLRNANSKARKWWHNLK